MRFLQGIERKLRTFRRRLAPLLYRGQARYCPVCSRSFRKFRPSGRHFRRPDATCPVCGSRERDRLLYRFLDVCRDELSVSGGPFVHVAPEASIAELCREIADGDYVSVDLVRRDVDVRLDIHALPFRDNSIGAVVCNHVLQDVVDDRRCLTEIYRSLATNGWAILNVPQDLAGSAQLTKEHADAPGIRRSDRSSRPSEYVRTYGTDYLERMRDTGFEVKRVVPDDIVDSSEQERLAVRYDVAGAIYLGYKRR